MIAAHRDREIPTYYFETILSEIGRIEGIISETLVLAKPSPINFKTVNINQTIQDVCTIMEPQALSRCIQLNTAYAPDLPLVRGEPNQLKQVFINLIKNSIEAMPEEGGSINLAVEQRTVSDSGCGISAKLLEKLGNPFVTTKDNGTGLGLMMTYRIIQNHGGTVQVTSSPGHGTVFQISLPVKN